MSKILKKNVKGYPGITSVTDVEAYEITNSSGLDSTQIPPSKPGGGAAGNSGTFGKITKGKVYMEVNSEVVPVGEYEPTPSVFSDVEHTVERSPANPELADDLDAVLNTPIDELNKKKKKKKVKRVENSQKVAFLQSRCKVTLRSKSFGTFRGEYISATITESLSDGSDILVLCHSDTASVYTPVVTDSDADDIIEITVITKADGKKVKYQTIFTGVAFELSSHGMGFQIFVII